MTQNVKFHFQNEDALATKIRIINSAKQSLDLAYFLWRNDETSSLIHSALLSAAEDRGVKIRLLLDGLYNLTEQDYLQVLASHPNIEVALYNPPDPAIYKKLQALGIRSEADLIALLKDPSSKKWILNTKTQRLAQQYFRGAFGRLSGLSFLSAQGLDSLNESLNELFGFAEADPVDLADELRSMMSLAKRMHHKLMIGDKDHMVVGGRNVENNYHLSDTMQGQFKNPQRSFTDADVSFTSSAMAEEATARFDFLWNQSRKIEAIENPARLWDKIISAEVCRSKNVEHLICQGISVPSLALDNTQSAYLENSLGKQRPRKDYLLLGEEESDLHKNLLRVLGATFPGQRVIMITPYFHPSMRMMDALIAALGRGVEITVITNSLQSTNHKITALGSRMSFQALLEKGSPLLKLWEQRKIDRVLHEKLIFFPDKVFIGSMNLDMRSEFLDTQNGVLVRDPSQEILRSYQVARGFDLSSDESMHRFYRKRASIYWEIKPNGLPERSIAIVE